MSWLTDPSPSDFDRWETLLRAGIEPAAAARMVGITDQRPEGAGYTCSAFRRANPVRHGELLDLSREVRGYVTDKIVEDDVCERDETGVPVAFKESASDAMKQFYARRHQPAYSGTTQVELTGAGGGPLELEDRSASLADLARVLEAAGALAGLNVGAAAEPEVADTRALLPAAQER